MEAGPLSLCYWQSLAETTRGRSGNVVDNSRCLVTDMLIGSLKHQLRPLITQCIKLVSSSLDADDFFFAMDEALPYFAPSEMPLDTSCLLNKLFKHFQLSFFTSLNVQSLISNAKLSWQTPLLCFANVSAAIVTFSHLQLPNFPDFQKIILAENADKPSMLANLEYLVTCDEDVHDEIRIASFQLLIQVIAALKTYQKSADLELTDTIGRVIDGLFDFIIGRALPVLCAASTTPCRERFCSVLMTALTDRQVVATHLVDRVLLKLIELPFDETNYAVQRSLLRLFRDLTPLTVNHTALSAVFRKLLHLCGSDFNDVRHQAASVSSEMARNSAVLPNEMKQIVCERLLDAISLVNPSSTNNEFDRFAPEKSAFVFMQCKSFLTKLPTAETTVRMTSCKVGDEKIRIAVNFVGNGSRDDVLLPDVTTAIESLVANYDCSASTELLFLLSVGNLEMLELKNRGCDHQIENYLLCCDKIFALLFGDDSPAFNDRSLGGYLVGREDPVWAILQSVANNMSTFASISTNAEHKNSRLPSICKMVRRVLFSTLHFGLLEQYSNLLSFAISSWPEVVFNEFEKCLCNALLQEDTQEVELELPFSEVRRGGGLALAFVALFNGLGRIGRFMDCERILRQRLVASLDCRAVSISSQAAVFHVLRAVFSYCHQLGDGKVRAQITDQVATLALLSLRMSAPFQTRNAAMQALTACVHPVIAEGIMPLWKLSRAFPTLCALIREMIKTPKNREVLSLTAALSMLGRVNPLVNPNGVERNDCESSDWDLEDDLLSITLSHQIAYVRSAAAQALVSVACTRCDVLVLLSEILQLINKWCTTSKESSSYLDLNAVHGSLLIIGRIIYLLRSSWNTATGGDSKNSNYVPQLPTCLDRSCPAICFTLRRLGTCINPDALLLHQLIESALNELSS